MSSIVTVSFLCKERNNGAILSLALSKLALAHGLSAALAVVGRGGSIFGIWKVFWCCVLNLRLKNRERIWPLREKHHTTEHFGVWRLSSGTWGRFSRSPALLVCSGSKWSSRTVSSQLGRHWATMSGMLACTGPTGPCDLSSAALSAAPGSRIFLGSQV